MTVSREAMVAPRRHLRCLLAVGLLLAAGAVAAAVLVGCGGDEAALDGTSWRLVRWSDKALDPAGFTITAGFEDGSIGGTSAVNSYSGPYATGPDGEFSAGPLASTMMAGTGEAARAERTYFELLESVTTFSRRGDTLTLRDAGGGEALVFELAAPAE